MYSEKSHNILLKTAIVCYGLFFCWYGFTDFTFESSTIYDNSTRLSLGVELILAVLLAPIFEECIFRAPLLIKTKLWRIVALIAGLLLLTFGLFRLQLQFFVIAAWLFTVAILGKKNHKSLIWISILAFALSHMAFEDGLSLDGIALFVFFLASGSLLTWVFLNFGLIKAILFHSVYNLIAFLLYLMVLNYGFDDSKKSTCLENHNTCIEWQRKPLWQTQTSKINLEDSQILVSNGKINSILDVMPDLDIEHYEYEILQDDKIKYDILIFNKNDSTLKNSQILKAMESAGLIKMSAK